MSVLDDLPLLNGWTYSFDEIERTETLQPGVEKTWFEIEAPTWVNFATARFDSPNATISIVYRGPYGISNKVDFSAKELYNYGLLNSNPFGIWTSVYDTDKDIYQIVAAPIRPYQGIKETKVGVSNPTSSTIKQLYFAYQMIVVRNKEKLKKSAREIYAGKKELPKLIKSLRAKIEELGGE